MLDRRVTFALLFAIFLEAAGGFIWAGQATERLAQLERGISAQTQLVERLARLEEQIQNARATLARIERNQDQARGRR